MKHLYYLGLGSNLGDGRETLNRAVAMLAQLGTIVAVSSYIESEPWGFESEHIFTNAVAALKTSLDPMTLLDETQSIERQMGRTSKHAAGESYTDRIIDIDLLEYDGPPLHNERLTLPHPFIGVRDFVRLPLQECRELVNKILMNEKI